jgi:hypothetical protein
MEGINFSAALRGISPLTVESELQKLSGILAEGEKTISGATGMNTFMPEDRVVDGELVEETALVPVNIPSLDRVRPQFEDFKKRATEILESAKRIQIIDEKTQGEIISLGGEASKLVKIVTAKRKEVTLNAEDFVQAVKGIANMITDPLTEAVQISKGKNNIYQTRVELERRNAEKLAKEAAAKLQADIDKEAKANGVAAPQVVAPAIPAAIKKVRTESGTTAYQAKRTVATILNENEVPREYCSPDMKLINDAVKQGVTQIPGVKIEEISETRYR